jgi:hypothetical protein
VTAGDARLVALIDESADQEYYRIGAMVTRVGVLADLAQGLDEVMARASATHGVAATAELHGHEMFHGGGAWEVLKSRPRARISVYGQALDVVARHAEAIVIRGVYRPRFKQRYANRPDWNEHEAALMFVIENLDGYAAREKQPMYLFADECRFAASVRRSLETFKSSGTWGYRSRVISHVQSIQFVDSATYRQIQAIDLVSFLNHRRASRRDTNPKAIAANENLWARISDRVIIDRDWRP